MIAKGHRETSGHDAHVLYLEQDNDYRVIGQKPSTVTYYVSVVLCIIYASVMFI